MANHLFRAWNPKEHPQIAEQDPQYAEYLASWKKRFPESQPSTRDKEDWGEHVSALVGFDRHGIQETLLESSSASFVSAASDAIAANDAGPVGFIYHGFSRGDAIHSFEPATRIVGQDARTNEIIANAVDSPLYRESVGRPLVAVSLETKEIDDAVRSVVGDSGQVFLKTIKKGMSGVFEIEPGRSPWAQICEQDENLMWDQVQFEGAKQFYTIQGLMQPTDEYRFHMWDGEPITGSACYSPFIPLHHQPSEHGAFDPRFAPNAFCPPEQLRRDDHMVGEYLEMAKYFGKKFKEENGGHLMAYTLDLCLDQRDDTIKVIEINPQLNAGRYAADANLWVKTVADGLHQIEQRERQQAMAMAAQAASMGR